MFKNTKFLSISFNPQIKAQFNNILYTFKLNKIKKLIILINDIVCMYR